MMHGGKKRRREVVLLNADELTGDLLGVEGAVLVLQRAALLDGDADAVRLRDGGGRSDECEGDGNEGGLAEHGGWSERDEGGAGEQVRGPEGRCLGVQGEKPGVEPGSWRRTYILESPAQDDSIAIVMDVSVRPVPLGCPPPQRGRTRWTIWRCDARAGKQPAVPRSLRGGVISTVAPDVAMFRSENGMVLSDKTLRVCVSGVFP